MPVAQQSTKRVVGFFFPRVFLAPLQASRSAEVAFRPGWENPNGDHNQEESSWTHGARRGGMFGVGGGGGGRPRPIILLITPPPSFLLLLPSYYKDNDRTQV